MAKRSRRPVRGEQTPAASEPALSQTSLAAPSATTPRSATRRTRSRRGRQEGLLERYRGTLFGGAAVIGLLLLGWLLFFQTAAGTAYACESLLTPGPVESVTPRPATPTPAHSVAASPSGSPAASPDPSPSASGSAAPSADPSAAPSGSPSAAPSSSPSASPTASPTPQPEPTARLGFTTTILGRDHVRDPNQTIRYGFCPPTSGDHINVTNRGPIRPAVYPRTQEQAPGGWIHNLEHGYTVALYRCTSTEDCPSEDEMAELQAFFDQAPTSINQACPRKVLVARFDQMSTRFALLAWGRALLMDDFDVDTALTFAEQWTDHDAVPERGAC
ncbi:hypothetical protein BH24CHL5_BH24CHL5_10300 [soil metagenome]